MGLEFRLVMKADGMLSLAQVQGEEVKHILATAPNVAALQGYLERVGAAFAQPMLRLPDEPAKKAKK